LNTDRIFTVKDNANLTRLNMIMINGRNINGGAIYNTGILNMVNCTVTNFKAVNGDGGAIYNLGYLNVSMSKLINNNAANGGAIYCYNGYNSYVNFNQITGNTPSTGEIYCPFGMVDANLNWWGSNLDPSYLVNYGVNVTSWMVMGIKADNDTVGDGGSLKIIVNLVHDNLNNYHDPAIFHLPDGLQVIFNTTPGTIQTPCYTENGTSKTIIKSGAVSRTALISALLDSHELNMSIKINSKPSVLSQTPKNKSDNKGKLKIITIVFSEPVQAGTNYSSISLRGHSGNIPIKTNILNSVLTITVGSYFTDGNYTLYLPYNCLKDISNNYMNQSFYSSFKVDNKAPKITLTPVSGSYNSTRTVYIKLDEAGAIYYSLNNSTPTKFSQKYNWSYNNIKNIHN